MDDYLVISNYLRGNPVYTFELGGYILPRYVGKVNLYESRKSELLGHNSSFCKNFENDLSKFIKSFGNKEKDYFDHIKEFIIPIEHIDFWTRILDELNLPEKHISRFTGFFKLDYFFPSLGVVVEIDSSYHFNKALYDLARDTYLSSIFGIKTIRLLNYGENKNNWNTNYSIFTSEFRSIVAHKKFLGISPKNRVSLDFSISIGQNYVRNNKTAFEYIVKLREKLGMKFLVNKTLDIKKDDSYEKEFWLNLESILDLVYKKKVNYVS